MSQDLEEAVFQTFEDICKLNDYDTTNVSGGSKPFKDFGGFDSLNAQEFCVMLSENIGKEVDIETAFGDQGRTLTISEVVQRIDQHLSDEGK